MGWASRPSFLFDALTDETPIPLFGNPPVCPITPYPTARLLWDALFQGLRARLRLCSPSGTSCCKDELKTE